MSDARAIGIDPGMPRPCAARVCESGVETASESAGEPSSAGVLAERIQALAGRLGGGPEAVLAVPAASGDGRRRALRALARRAGLAPLRLLGAPTAVALARAGADGVPPPGRIAVFRLGPDSFDVAILQNEGGFLEVLAVAGDDQLGGAALDRQVAEELLREARVDPAALDKDAYHAALEVVRNVRHRLGDRFDADVRLPLPDGREHHRTLSRDQLDALVRPSLGRLVPPCRQVMADLGLQPEQLDAVLLAGRSTRAPFVRRLVGEVFGRRPLVSAEPACDAARGAAWYAGRLASDPEATPATPLVLELCPWSLALERDDGTTDELIPRASPVPASAHRVLAAPEPEREQLVLRLVQGSRPVGVRIDGLRGEPVELRFQLDVDAVLEVTARAPGDRPLAVQLEHEDDRVSG